MDFIAPEPSYEQVTELEGQNGVDKIFPFYLTKTQVSVNGVSRITTVLLSDQFQNVGITMYNEARVIEKVATEVINPIYIDWQFAQDTGAKPGDRVSFTINGAAVEFQVYAIYETNIIYDGAQFWRRLLLNRQMELEAIPPIMVILECTLPLLIMTLAVPI